MVERRLRQPAPSRRRGRTDDPARIAGEDEGTTREQRLARAFRERRDRPDEIVALLEGCRRANG